MTKFMDALSARVLVCDGAMGTMLYGKGVFINKSFDALNVTDPALVAGVHAEYVAAGADVVETNTFGANRIKLAPFGLVNRLDAINAEGARIARNAVSGRAYVAGAIGPLGIRIEPWGKTGVDEAREYFREQAQALLEGGVDLFILETFRDLNEIGAAIDAVRSLSDLPIVAQMTTEENGDTLDGTPPERFAPELERRGANVLGVNCAVGPAPMLETIERMELVTKLPLSAQPNAGKPRDVEGRNIYLCSPEYMATYAKRFIQHNVRLVGGCCGTTPEHIRQIKAAVRTVSPESGRAAETAGRGARVQVGAALAQSPVARTEKSRFARKLAAGGFAVVVELLPSRGFDARPLIERAAALEARGVDVVNIPDSQRSGARMSALSLAVLIEQRTKIETLLHYSSRDRSLLGIQSDLLGAHAMGLCNLLLITGEPGRVGDFPDATSVFDVDSIGLTNVVHRLNQGFDVGGQAIGAPTAFHIGVAVNPGASNIDEELRRFDYKVEAGAEFVVTRPVFDLAAFDRFHARIAHARLPVVVGISVFDSLRAAEFMANEVPGLTVPEAMIERMRQAEARGAAGAEGVAIARELAVGLKALKGKVQGIQVSTAPGNLDDAVSVLDGLI